jgi:hypothetical protein
MKEIKKKEKEKNGFQLYFVRHIKTFFLSDF